MRQATRFVELMLLVLIGCSVLIAQDAPSTAQRPHIGRVVDWTYHHYMFSGGLAHANLHAAKNEPRLLFHLADRNLARGRFRDDDGGRDHEREGHRRHPRIDGSVTQHARDLQIDWSFDLGTGRVAPNMSPAKFGFDTAATPNCTNDYVVYGLNVPGATNGQANVVGIRNLYSGTNGICGASPTLYWAYNGSTVGGSVLTSPTLSLDGTKIAFVESAGTASVFHVLTWKAGEGSRVTRAATPLAAASCTATSSCLLSVKYANVTTTLASPWIDYATDKAFVAADDGTIARISCVFKCPLKTNPTVDWTYKLPVAGTDGPNPVPSGPVYYYPYKRLFITDQLGEVWVLNAGGATPSLYAGPVMIGGGGCTTANPPGRKGTPAPCTADGKSYGIPDSVILDGSGGSGKIFVFTGNDGGQGPLNGNGVHQSALVAQMNQDLTGVVKVYLGRGSVGLNTGNVDIHSGTFNDGYWGNTPDTDGLLYACGTGANDTTPYHYWIGFANWPVMDSSYTGTLQRLNAAGVSCTAYGEFYNANLDLNNTPGHHDLLFSGLVDATNGYMITNDISQVGFTAALNFVSYPGGISAQVIDNDSPSGQASSIYFGTLTSSTVGTCNGNCAVKLTQANLR